MNCLGEAVGKIFGRPPSTSVYCRDSTYSVGLKPDSRSDFQSYGPAHTDGITSLCSAGAGFCLSGGTDKKVVLFNFISGELIDSWRAHEREISKVAYGPKSNLFCSGSRDKTIMIWQHGVIEPVQILAGHELVVTGLAISPTDNTHICSGSRDNCLRLWDVQTGDCVAAAALSRNLVTHITWSPVANFIAQTGEDKELRLWDPRSLKVIHEFKKKQHIQTCCDVSEDGRLCVTSSNGFSGNGCEATLWDLRQRQLLHEFHGHEESISSCAFITKTEPAMVITVSNDKTIRIWNRDTAGCLVAELLDGVGTLSALACPASDIVLVGTTRHGIQQYTLEGSGNALSLRRVAQF